jgi:hypothetical protein
MLHGPVVVAPAGMPAEEVLGVAGELTAQGLAQAGSAGIETVFARPQGLDRVWVRAGFIPVPEAELPRGLRGRPGLGLFGWRGGTALWSTAGRGGSTSPCPANTKPLVGMRITALAGGTSAPSCFGARSSSMPEPHRDRQRSDDAEIWNLHVSPDLDTICYTLGGILDERKGWGLAGDLPHPRPDRALRGQCGQPQRPRLGHHLCTQLLREAARWEATRAIIGLG